MYGRKFRKTYRRYGRKRSTNTYRRRQGVRTRRSGRSRAMSMYRPLGAKWANPLPNQRLFKFVYNDEGFTTDTGVGFINNYIFRANSLYDPDETGVGVQPYGFDQYFTAAGPYNQYEVLASKISIYVHSNTSENKSPVKVTILPWLNSSFPTAIETTDLARHAYARTNLVDVSKDDTRNCKISNYVSIRKQTYNGRISGDSYSAQYTTNPADQVYWYVQFSTSTTSIQSTYKWDVKITYYTRARQTHSDINES